MRASCKPTVGNPQRSCSSLPILSNDDNGITRVTIINREQWYSLNQSTLSIIINSTWDICFIVLSLSLISFSLSPMCLFKFNVALSFLICSFLDFWGLQVNLVTASKLSVLGNLWPVENYSGVSSARVIALLLTFMAHGWCCLYCES